MKGTIAGFGWDGIHAESGKSHHVSDIRSIQNGYNSLGHGIYLGNYSKVQDCIASGNTLPGIFVGTNSLIIRNVVDSNDDDGIVTGESSVVTYNTANNNTKDGIEDGWHSVIMFNTCTGNDEKGIETGESIIKNNTCYDNDGDDIFCDNVCVNVDNLTTP